MKGKTQGQRAFFGSSCQNKLVGIGGQMDVKDVIPSLTKEHAFLQCKTS
jgi:hypothetical protein